MFYITGDTHGSFLRIAEFCSLVRTTKEDVLIILGDAGINYYGNSKDLRLKQTLNTLPITLFCIHGNHERRPFLPQYEEALFYGGHVFIEPAFPNLIFAKDGEVYNFNRQTLVIGGAYSIDKYYRLNRGFMWFSDEQPDATIKQTVTNKIQELHNKIDVVLTHTSPFSYMPTEAFLPGLDQSLIDNSTEQWLEQIKNKLQFNDWYCGHFHINKNIDNFHFLFEKIEEFK